MPPAVDTIQLVREALVEALDTLPAIAALTGRASGNVVPFKNRDKADVPAIAYHVVVGAPAGGVGECWEVQVQFSAIAEDDDDERANKLLALVQEYTRPQYLAANAVTPLDAYQKQFTRRGVGEDLSARADLDITFIVTNHT